MHFHEAAHEHIAVFAQVILESQTAVEGAVARWEVGVLKVAFR